MFKLRALTLQLEVIHGSADYRLHSCPELRHLIIVTTQKRVLVVDDSLTVRELERKLLDNGGYGVDIPVDGMDGWNAVRTGDYDLVDENGSSTRISDPSAPGASEAARRLFD
jgi:hypothetical protein